MDTIRKKMSYGYFFIDQNFSRNKIENSLEMKIIEKSI